MINIMLPEIDINQNRRSKNGRKNDKRDEETFVKELGKYLAAGRVED